MKLWNFYIDLLHSHLSTYRHGPFIHCQNFSFVLTLSMPTLVVKEEVAELDLVLEKEAYTPNGWLNRECTASLTRYSSPTLRR